MMTLFFPNNALALKPTLFSVLYLYQLYLISLSFLPSISFPHPFILAFLGPYTLDASLAKRQV